MEKEKSCGCIVFDDGKVLMIMHKEGHWDLPKGHVEEGETEVETAIREVKEETNIDVEVNEKYRYTLGYSPKENVWKDVVYFVASKKGGEIQAQLEEVQSVEWVEISEAIDRLTFDVTREVLRKAVGDLGIYI